jgi:hypothetical protein
MTKLLGEKLLENLASNVSSLSIRLPAVIGRGSKRNCRPGGDHVIDQAFGRR